MLNDKIANAKRRDIHDRIYKLALETLDVVKKVPKSIENIVLVRQLVRSATSVGANALEADGSETRKEFIHRFAIAKKEAKESYYWFSLLGDHNPELKEVLEPLRKENNEIILIISKIIINTKSNTRKVKDNNNNAE